MNVTSLQLAGFPHSDIKGSMPACGSPLLPLAFRSLPRPSSALGALASTLCSSSLDYVDPETSLHFLRSIDFQFATGLSRLLSRLLLCAVVKVRGEFPSPSGFLFRILKTIQMIGSTVLS